jgi:hypothetical protein
VGAVSRRAHESHPGIVQPIRLIFDGVRELVGRRPYTAFRSSPDKRLRIAIAVADRHHGVLHPDRSLQTM